MADGKSLAVNLEQLRGSSASLHADTHEAMSALEQISSGPITSGFAALGALFDEVGAAGSDMMAAWSAADGALKDRLVGTAERLGASADLYHAADSGNADALAVDIETKKGS
ncbi:MAG: type VII secretion target [Segniliparus sp.]|uniref:type VII secretion target n=1 Tax=Segniliparus sp. TaxID=2804064 RepID=UPI003F33B31B